MRPTPETKAKSIITSWVCTQHLNLEYSTTAQPAVKRNDYSRPSQQWSFDCSCSALTKSVKSVGELEAAASSNPNPISPTASQLKDKGSNNSTVHYRDCLFSPLLLLTHSESESFNCLPNFVFTSRLSTGFLHLFQIEFQALFKRFQAFSAPYSCGKLHINKQYILYIQYTDYFTSFHIKYDFFVL